MDAMNAPIAVRSTDLFSAIRVTRDNVYQAIEMLGVAFYALTAGYPVRIGESNYSIDHNAVKERGIPEYNLPNNDPLRLGLILYVDNGRIGTITYGQWLVKHPLLGFIVCDDGEFNRRFVVEHDDHSENAPVKTPPIPTEVQLEMEPQVESTYEQEPVYDDSTPTEEEEFEEPVEPEPPVESEEVVVPQTREDPPGEAPEEEEPEDDYNVALPGEDGYDEPEDDGPEHMDPFGSPSGMYNATAAMSIPEVPTQRDNPLDQFLRSGKIWTPNG